MNDAREVDHGTGGVMNLTGVSDDPVRRYYEHLAGQVMSLKTFIIGELKDSANVHPAMRYITEGAALGFDAAIKSIEAAFAIAEEHPSDDDNGRRSPTRATRPTMMSPSLRTSPMSRWTPRESLSHSLIA